MKETSTSSSLFHVAHCHEDIGMGYAKAFLSFFINFHPYILNKSLVIKQRQAQKINVKNSGCAV